LSDTSGTLESYSYLGLGIVVKRAHPFPTNGLDLTYIGLGTGDAGDQYTGLDRFGRVVEQKWQTEQMTPTVTDDFTYGYDRDSNRLYRKNLVNTAFSELYHANGSSNGYDNLNQLVAFARGTLNGTNDTITSPSHSITWSLDAVGNFSSTTTDGGSAASNSFNKQNEETAAGNANLAFDNNGNTTTDDQGKTLVYDAWNRLVAYKNGSTTLENYKYDGLNRRIVQNPGTATDLYYSAAWQVLEERTGGVTTATLQYVWSPVYVDALILRDRSTQNNGTLDERSWVQQDANWNITALLNGSGLPVQRYFYDPYGKPNFLNGSWATLPSSAYAWVCLFQGQRLDTTSALSYFRRRNSSPTLGRFQEPDPLGIETSRTNLYLLEADAPTNGTDPTGTMTWKAGPYEAWLMGNLIRIRFHPGLSKKVTCCARIVNVQVMQVVGNGTPIPPGKLYHSWSWEDPISTPVGFWHVDTFEDYLSPVYQDPANDYHPNPMFDLPSGGTWGIAGYKVPTGERDAVLIDTPSARSGGDAGWAPAPGGWKEIDYNFQTFAFCESGPDRGKWYEGMSWMYHNTSKDIRGIEFISGGTATVKTDHPGMVFGRHLLDSPTDTFRQALALYFQRVFSLFGH
jgi:RHS repeat-associated protein